MSRNEKCFCGSGLKKKKCHGDIHNNSLVANLIKIYNELDSKIASDVKCKCSDNCSKCCYDYFYISEEEFLVIMYYLEKNFTKDKIQEIFNRADEYMENIKKNYREEYNKLNDITYGLVDYNSYDKGKFIPRIMRTEKSCVFLENGRCSIYEVRPYICRTFGTLNNVFFCDDVIVEKDEFEYNGLEKILNKGINSEYELILGQKYFERGYPISDFIVSLYNINKNSGKLTRAIKSDRVEYVKNKLRIIRK